MAITGLDDAMERARAYEKVGVDAIFLAGGVTTEAIEARLSAFGFAEADRTRRTLRQLTRGLTRSSRLMQQMLPLPLSDEDEVAAAGRQTLRFW